jgi:murein DD-endopeptidase MepM/ murein hydrolase activator NlpD
MIQLSISLPTKRRLDLRLVKRRNSPLEKPFLPSLDEIRKIRKGSKVSRFFRHIFEHNKIKRLLGANLALILVASSFLPIETSETIKPETNIISQNETPLKTEKKVRYPVDKIKITQGYSIFHPGIDLDGVTGDPIYSIMNGEVEATSRSPLAYGKAVYIKHEEGLSSLYAHLSKIEVEKGQEVTTRTKLGEMGSTGHAFGDHLHLEIRKDGYPINPLTVLPAR